MYEIWYGVTSVIFGTLLYFPIRKVIYGMTFNRFVAKNKAQPSEEEATKMRKRSYIIAAIIAITFAFVYNKIVMVKYFAPRMG